MNIMTPGVGVATADIGALMEAYRAAIEAGTHHGLPAINPLVMPTELFEGHAHIHVGGLHIDACAATEPHCDSRL